MIEQIRTELIAKGSPEKAAFLSGFFKTGIGQYAEGDVFVGVNNPEVRAMAKKYADLPLTNIETLLHDPVHEIRLLALVILVNRFEKASRKSQQVWTNSPQIRKDIFDLYLRNLEFINNWDLVDVSCHKIVGAYLFDKERDILYELAARPHLWSQRVAMVSTFNFIRHRQVNDTYQLAELLLPHPHDLMHKAVGWMLREAGKRDEGVLEDFLQTHIRQMPRMALRYAIERFEETKRKYYLSL
jgi:3-methyladenine DNA glycosylase AlkD